jgi:ABC-type glycerol-3-phosphate transport system substrate-binding protein
VPAAVGPAGHADEKTKGKISIWLGYPETLDAFKLGQVEFKKKYPNVDVEILTFELREFEAKLAVSVPAGSGPDILALHDFIFPRYYEGGNLADMPADPRGGDQRTRSSTRRSRTSSPATASRGACRGGPAATACSTTSIT